MTYIGVLEQRKLSNILQRIEFYQKTGLLTITQGEQRIELFFQLGQVTCIGPFQWRALVKKLLQAGFISHDDLQKALQVMGAAHNTMLLTMSYSEMEIALTLAELGLVSHERLYTLARQEVTEVFQNLLSWSTGEIYFQEGVQSPIERFPFTLRITSLIPSPLGSTSTSKLSIDNPRPAREEPSTPLTGPSTLFKTPRLLIEESSIPATPRPLLFKKSRPSVEELPISVAPFPTDLETPNFIVQEQLNPATPVPARSNIVTLVDQAIVPSSVTTRCHPSSDDTTVKLSAPSMPFGKRPAVRARASGKWYMVLTWLMPMLLLLLPNTATWTSTGRTPFLSAPSLAALNATIARSEEYITNLYKPIDDQTATIAEYFGVPLRVYLTRYHHWILLGENSTAFCIEGGCFTTSAITGVENRQSSETFFAEFRSPKYFVSPQIRVDVNWNYDAKHYQIKLTNEQFDDQNTTALVYLYDLYVNTFSSTNVGHYSILTFAKTDITHLHSFRYTIRHGNQLGQNYYWYKQDRAKYERLVKFLAQRSYRLDYDIYAPIWGYGTSYPDDLPYHISSGDGNEVYHDCHASSWKDNLNYLYESKICKVGIAVYNEISRRDLLTITIQALHILNKYGNPERSYADSGNQLSTPLSVAVDLEQKFDQSGIGIPMCSPIGCNYGLASGVRTFNFGALETLLGYSYGRQDSQAYADAVARLALEVQVGDNDTLLMADGSKFYRPAQKGAFYLSWDASMQYSQSKPFGYEYLNGLLNMPDEYRGVLVSDMETTFNAYAFLVLYRCKKYSVGCTAGAQKPPIT